MGVDSEKVGVSGLVHMYLGRVHPDEHGIGYIA